MSTVIEHVMRWGAYVDYTFDKVPRGMGDPWCPNDECVVVDARELFSACYYDSAGRQAWLPGAARAQMASDPYRLQAEGTRQSVVSAAEQWVCTFWSGDKHPGQRSVFPQMWLELGTGAQDTRIQYGVFIADEADQRETHAYVCITFPPLRDAIMLGSIRYSYDTLERCCGLSEAGMKLLSRLPDDWLPYLASRPIEPGASGDNLACSWFDDSRLHWAVWLALTIPHTRSGDVVQRQVKRGKKTKRDKPRDRIVWHDITINGASRGVVTATRGKRGGDAVTRQHLCRGHFAEYTEDKPLFGNPNNVGFFWREAHVRGNPSFGSVIQRHRIEPT